MGGAEVGEGLVGVGSGGIGGGGVGVGSEGVRGRDRGCGQGWEELLIRSTLGCWP